MGALKVLTGRRHVGRPEKLLKHSIL